MDKWNSRLSRQRANWTVALLSVICLCIFTYIFTQWQQNGTFLPVWDASSQSGDEQVDGTYFTLYDQDTGEAVEYMSRKVYVGDELLTGDNKHYKVTKIDGQNAYCQLLEERQLREVLAELQEAAKAVSTQPGAFQAIAIYCTHTDESYVPTSGTESKNGGGDILDVATVMATVLEEQGVTVIHSENIHDPHDVNAYQRSRKTAAELLQEAPAAMIDVHRDGVPDPDYYATEFDGEAATQIRLVVGRQNQNSEANIEFAEKMKAYYDEVKPGLIKSIFMAKGNYNQDLAPHSVLLEVGTHTNSLEEAEVGAREFAEVLPQFLGLKTAAEEQEPNATVQEEPQAQTAAEKSGGMGKAILWLVVLAAVGGFAFVWISRGSLKRVDMGTYTEAILLGMAAGFLARLYMLRTDYRNYPSYPHGYIIHLSLGAIAASLAAIALPALLEEEYTAITFLVLCAQQFRDIRNMERETLMKLEENTLVPRGLDYIEGIAKVFESRNYLVMLVALVTSGATIFGGQKIGILAGVALILFSRFLMRGSFIRDIARVEEGTLHFEKSLLYIDDIVIMNVGDLEAREKILQEGVAIVLHPYDDDGRSVLNNLGQRQALLHDISMLVGNKLEIGEQEWTPAARKNMDTGALGIFLLPNEKDIGCVIEAAKRTPVLESAVQKPLANTIGREASD